MKPAQKIIFASGAAVVLAVGAFFYFHNSASAAIGNLNIYDGTADISRSGAIVNGANGIDVDLSDTITVPQGSRVSIILKDGTEVRLESGTTVTVSDIEYNGQKLSNAVFDLKSGEAWSHVSPLATGGKFEVETPTVVATVRGTNFDVSYDGTQSQVYVSTHAVWVALRSDLTNVIQLNAGSFILIHDSNAALDFAAGPQTNFIKTDWTFFNEGKDEPVESDPADSTSTPQAPTPTSTPTSTAPAPKTTTHTTVKSMTTVKVVPPPAPTPAPAASMTLDLEAANLSINQNDVDPLTVKATYPNGSTADVTKTVSWKLSPALNIIDTQGNLHASFTGATTITASLSGVTSNAVVIMVNQATVQQPAPVTLTSISVSCTVSSPQYNLTYAALPTAQCAAMGTYSNDSSQDVTTSVAWSNSGSAGGTIDTKGRYIPRAAGTETITATLSGVTGSTSVPIE